MPPKSAKQFFEVADFKLYSVEKLNSRKNLLVIFSENYKNPYVGPYFRLKNIELCGIVYALKIGQNFISKGHLNDENYRKLCTFQNLSHVLNAHIGNYIQNK